MSLYKKGYCKSLRMHYENYYRAQGIKKNWKIGPVQKLHPEFYVLEIKPNKIKNMWAYLTVGMSIEREDTNLIELLIYSPYQEESIIELLTLIASFHRNSESLNLHHTVNLGRPWLPNSKCEYGFISQPYLDGEKLEIFNIDSKIVHCYWYIPITEKERGFKVEMGCEALEELFEQKSINYLNPHRKCLISDP